MCFADDEQKLSRWLTSSSTSRSSRLTRLVPVGVFRVLDLDLDLDTYENVEAETLAGQSVKKSVLV